MSTITILPLNEQIPSFTEYYCSISNENKRTANPSHEVFLQFSQSNSADSSIKHNFTWEYFSNELEFE